jgi:hypothetical protein
MDGRDPSESPEVVVIEGNQMRDSVPNHSRDEPRIVSRLAVDVVFHHKLPPMIKDGSLVSKKVELIHDLSQIVFGFGSCQTQPILGDGTSRNDPILRLAFGIRLR